MAGEVLKYAEDKYWDISDEMLLPLALVIAFLQSRMSLNQM